MTTRIPGRSDTESFTDDRPTRPADPPAGSDTAVQPAARPQGRGLPAAVTDAAAAVREETRSSRTPGASNGSPWQRSHAVWRRAGIDWTRDRAARPPETADAAAPAEVAELAEIPDPPRPPEPADTTPAAEVGKTARRTGAAPEGPPPAPRSRRGRRVGPLAVAGVLVVGIGAYALQRAGQDETPAGPAATDADRMFATDPAAGSDGRSQTLAAVTAAGNTVVALGSDRVRGQFLVSSDGGHGWRVARVRASDGGEPPPAEFPRRIAGGKGAWVALGGPAAGASAPGGAPAAASSAAASAERAKATGGPAIGGVVWTSGDGLTWTRESGTPAFEAGDRVTALVRTASGFVAVGSGPGGAVVWSSPDGRGWQRTPAGRSGLAGAVRLERLAAIGDTLVAQGTRRRTVTTTVTKGTRKRKVSRSVEVSGHWRSADGGRGWTAVSVPQGQGSYGDGDGLVGGPGGFVLTREAQRVTRAGKKRKRIRYGVVFTSADGAKWAVSGRLTGADYLRVDRLSGAAEGVAALVRVSGGKTAVMRSADGRIWRRVTDITGRALTDLAVLPTATVVTGRKGDDAYLSLPGTGDVDLAGVAGAVQPERTVAALASAGSQVMAVGSTNGNAAIWSGGDGRPWSRAQGKGLGGDGAQRLTDVVTGGRGWAAVGSGGDAPLVMTSPDGTVWRRSVDGLSHDFRPAGAAFGPVGYVVVGRAGTAAAAWRSADLKTWTRGSGDLDDAAGMSDVAAVSTGYVAVGGVTRDKAERPAVWTSADGRRWTFGAAVPVPPGAEPGALIQVVARGDTMVARGASFVTTSGDGGRTWQSQVFPGATAAITAAGTTSRGFVVAGTAGAPGRGDVVLWSSADGRGWRSIRPHGTGLDGPGAQRLTALTASGGDLLAVGFTGDHRGETPTLWRTPSP